MLETDETDRGNDSSVIEVDGPEAGHDDTVVIRNVSFDVRWGRC
jgi:hypothetical protein